LVLGIAVLRGVVLAAVTRRRWPASAHGRREVAPTARRSERVRVR
jgi:hypothetical protein